MPEQTSAPTTLTNEAGFYSKVGANPAESNLFFRGENNGFEYQLTKSIAARTAIFANNTAYPGAGANTLGGWTFLPGGLILQYGSVLPGQSSPQTGTTNFPVPFSSIPFIVMPTGVSRNAGVGTQSRVITVKDGGTTTNLFQWTWDNGTSNYVGFNWIAIGI